MVFFFFLPFLYVFTLERSDPPHIFPPAIKGGRAGLLFLFLRIFLFFLRKEKPHNHNYEKTKTNNPEKKNEKKNEPGRTPGRTTAVVPLASPWFCVTARLHRATDRPAVSIGRPHSAHGSFGFCITTDLAFPGIYHALPIVLL